MYQHHIKGGNVVLVDVLRFTSTLVTALANGALWAETYAEPDKALMLREKGYVVAGEHNGVVIDGFMYNNSPVSMSRENVNGKKLAFVTTNGTYTRSLIDTYDALYAGCFLNVDALVDRLISEDKDVQIVCSGARRRMAVEDFVFAGMVADKLVKTQKYTYEFDTVAMATTLYHTAKDDLRSFVLNSAPRLKLMIAKFPHYKEDFDFSMQQNIFDVVPEEESPFKFVVK